MKPSEYIFSGFISEPFVNPRWQPPDEMNHSRLHKMASEAFSSSDTHMEGIDNLYFSGISMLLEYTCGGKISE